MVVRAFSCLVYERLGILNPPFQIILHNGTRGVTMKKYRILFDTGNPTLLFSYCEFWRNCSKMSAMVFSPQGGVFQDARHRLAVLDLTVQHHLIGLGKGNFVHIQKLIVVQVLPSGMKVTC